MTVRTGGGPRAGDVPGEGRSARSTVLNMTESEFALERFVAAQNQGSTYAAAVAELRAGYKTAHWMWFVFPQIAGLGHSAMSERYAISSITEARAYLAHPILGSRLIECAQILNEHSGRSAEDIFGGIDAMKLRSSMTLFAHAAPADARFQQLLDIYFSGEPDEATERILNRQARQSG
jgi:uncharacterized protein (DUF1810 family)